MNVVAIIDVAKDLIKYLGILLIGGYIGHKGHMGKKVEKNLDRMQTFCLLLMLFLMGLSIGLDKVVMDNLFTIGIHAFIISILTIVGSMFFIRLIKRFIKIKGDTHEQ